MHERAAALDPNVFGEVAELDEVIALARVKHDPNNHSAAFGVVKRSDDDGVGQGIGREVVGAPL